MWPQKAPKRNVKYFFELFETALHTTRKGLAVLHGPDLIIRLHNTEVKSNRQLIQLSNPEGYKPPKPVKVYLVGRKRNTPVDHERKLAKFIRGI